MMGVNDVEPPASQESSHQCGQRGIYAHQLAERRTRACLAVGRDVEDAVNLDIRRHRARSEVIGRDMDLMSAIRYGFREPQDADRRATRNGKRTGRDDGDS